MNLEIYTCQSENVWTGGQEYQSIVLVCSMTVVCWRVLCVVVYVVWLYSIPNFLSSLGSKATALFQQQKNPNHRFKTHNPSTSIGQGCAKNGSRTGIRIKKSLAPCPCSVNQISLPRLLVLSHTWRLPCPPSPSGFCYSAYKIRCRISDCLEWGILLRIGLCVWALCNGFHDSWVTGSSFVSTMSCNAEQAHPDDGTWMPALPQHQEKSKWMNLPYFSAFFSVAMPSDLTPVWFYISSLSLNLYWRQLYFCKTFEYIGTCYRECGDKIHGGDRSFSFLANSAFIYIVFSWREKHKIIMTDALSQLVY